MITPETTFYLRTCLEKYKDRSGHLLSRLNALIAENMHNGHLKELGKLYAQVITDIEEKMSLFNYGDEIVVIHRNLFLEWENHLSINRGKDRRFNFLIVIPVADRPEHLSDCLTSLLELCRYFNYGNQSYGVYQKITVFIVDDSKEESNQQRNKDLASDFSSLGLSTRYISSREQRDSINQLSTETKNALQPLVGTPDGSDFTHKGPSITRNIAYLIISKYLNKKDSTLIFFIDSDQEFSITVERPQGKDRLFIINYFYYLDRIFSQCDVDILTGKVVGDPPVSPAVMMGNFLTDVCHIFKFMACSAPFKPLALHNEIKNSDYLNEAAYHDMAELFGYPSQSNPLPCISDISPCHSAGQLFKDFSRTIIGFFQGNHPTRRTPYIYNEPLLSIKPARTVYTGNYILRAHALRYFIPFADLRLRMAGPVLGRIVKAGRGERFVSANLPMLHKRTVGDNQSGYRAGIEHRQDIIDLSGEFERQFWGDVMLFTIEHLAGSEGYPQKKLSLPFTVARVEETRKEMKKMYEKKHKEIILNINMLYSYIKGTQYWWNKQSEFKDARERYENFLENVIYNFGAHSHSYSLIDSTDKIKHYSEMITRAIVRYPDDMTWWEKALEEIKR